MKIKFMLTLALTATMAQAGWQASALDIAKRALPRTLSAGFSAVLIGAAVNHASNTLSTPIKSWMDYTKYVGTWSVTERTLFGFGLKKESESDAKFTFSAPNFNLTRNTVISAILAIGAANYFSFDPAQMGWTFGKGLFDFVKSSVVGK